MNINSIEFAQSLDDNDHLAEFVNLFEITDPELIYLDGNSLGRMPKAAAKLGHEIINQQWADRLVRGWGEGWMEAPLRIGNKIAPIIGANPGEVLLADSTSINLYKLASAALQHQTGRRKIITDDLNFPSDIYILGSVISRSSNQHHLEVVPSQGGIHGPEEAILSALNQETALVSLSLTTFKSGFTYDLARLTAAAHEVGAQVLWDLSHSAGVVPIELAAAGVDFAVGCTYKYLNGGPGAPAFLYVREDLQPKTQNPIAGWMGQEQKFDFSLEYRPALGLSRMLTGTPAILSAAMIEPGLDILLQAGIEPVREKSILLTNYFIELAKAALIPLGFRINSPLDSGRRGSHISLGHDEGLRINKALINEFKIIPDFRVPDNLRFGFAPLYTTFSEVYQAVFALKEIVESKIYLNYSQDKPSVT